MINAPTMLRLCSLVLHTAMGAFAVFCLCEAAIIAVLVTNPKTVWFLVEHAVVWGGLASALLYCQGKYLA
jgi:hypothetical protein